MRRRLTVTGASQNIDGVVKPGITESSELKKFKGKKDKVSRLVPFRAMASPAHLVGYKNLSLTRVAISATVDPPMCRHGVFWRVKEGTRPLQP